MKTKLLLSFILIVTLCAAAMFMAARTRFPIRYLDIIEANAGELETSFVLAVIMAESSFNSRAESRAGAQGLMQLMPPTAADMAARMGMTDFQPYHVWEPEVNIALGTFYLNWLKNRYNGNLDLVLAAYNAGLGRVDTWLADPELSQDGVTLDVIPFPETYNYLNRIRQFQRIYRVLLALYRR
ncbi:MAG: lytic transglycosylase domain-containing protein [Firmicutes bacterium]|nr:lytic transglycosylase domain-containing protein [Bacillota bacterium]